MVTIRHFGHVNKLRYGAIYLFTILGSSYEKKKKRSDQNDDCK